MTWTPLMCFATIVLVYCIGEYLSNLTKGFISSMIFASFIGMALFWTDLIPKDIATKSQLYPMLNAFVIAILIINMGTSIDLEQFIMEWRTVATCVAGLIGLGVLAFTLGTALFGREYALIAAPPISGGAIAYNIVSEEALAHGRGDLAGYAYLVLAYQKFIGMPVISFCLKMELKKMKEKNMFAGEKIDAAPFKLPETKLFPDWPKTMDSNTWKYGRLGLAGICAYLLTQLTGGALNVNISYLIMGILLRKINFLQKNSLQAAGGYGLCMMAMYAMMFNGLASLTPADLLRMILPIIGMLVIGSIGIAIGSAIIGKLVGYPIPVAIACGMTALLGYPGTEIISREVCDTMEGFTDKEKAMALDFVMPKMIIGGFTTVTVASVVFAGIIAPMIFG
ncbi:MAG: hypothetical protein II971_05875 [Firmicutes bacterium]|nr:hypothetical protein [Bacillota bacterium]